MDCLFCKIVSGEIPTQLHYEDEDIIAFNDIRPQAPHHILIIPKKHIPTLNDLTEEDTFLVGSLVQKAKHIAKLLNVDQSGFRVVMNCNEWGGQTVHHIHMHLLSGRQMHWPPG